MRDYIHLRTSKVTVIVRRRQYFLKDIGGEGTLLSLCDDNGMMDHRYTISPMNIRGRCYVDTEHPGA